MKIKRFLFSFILLFSVIFSVACKGKNDDNKSTKADPVVTIVIENREFRVGEVLKNIDIQLNSESTSGSVAWVNGNYVLTEGENKCYYKFVPTDKDVYNEKVDYKIINALPLDVPEVNVSAIDGQTVYADAKYDIINLQATATFDSLPVEGEVFWKNPDKLFVGDRENVCEWEFIPTDGTRFAKVSGTITLPAGIEQTIEALIVDPDYTKEYEAYDQFDKENLILCWKYNAGKIEVIEDFKSLVTFEYKDGESLKRGDTSVKIRYSGYEVEATGLTVGYKPIIKPESVIGQPYTGSSQTMDITETNYYRSESPVTGTDHGVYELVVTLKDPDNCIWENGDEISTTIDCIIPKNNINIENEFDYSDIYDEYEHFVSVTSSVDADIYYSEVQLTEENYLTLFDQGVATLDEIGKSDAGNYVIYYYIDGGNNYNGKTGSLSLEIEKQTPIVNLEYCYALKPNNGSVVNYPNSYIKVVNDNGNNVSGGEFKFTYYSYYVDDLNSTNDTKTTTAANGAVTEGGAPKNAKDTEYFVVVEFLGTKNYKPAKNVAVLFIDGSNPNFYAKNDGDAFAFKDDVYIPSIAQTYPEYMINGSNQECSAYVEFSECELNSDGVRTISVVTKFYDGHQGIKNGRLAYADGKYKLLTEDGKIYDFSYDSENEEITIDESQYMMEIVLKKWELPKYLNTYSAITVEDMNDKHTSQETVIKIENDCGTIRFSVDVNVPYDSGALVSIGHYQWAGVAEVDVQSVIISQDPLVRKECFVLDCYIINKDTLESEGYFKTLEGFRLIWPVEDGVNPSTITIFEGIGSLLTGGELPVLIGQQFTKVTA